MNFSQYLSLIENPVYKVKKKAKAKAKEQKSPPEPYDGYQVFGSNGMDGGYAIEEKPVKEAMEGLSREERERDAKRKKDAETTRHKFRDTNVQKKSTNLSRGEYLKFNKDSGNWESNKNDGSNKAPLRKGEVRSFNKTTNKWESNKD